MVISVPLATIIIPLVLQEKPKKREKETKRKMLVKFLIVLSAHTDHCIHARVFFTETYFEVSTAFMLICGDMRCLLLRCQAI